MASGYQSEQQRLNTLLSNKLIVRVIEARGLKAADILSGTSDPYAEVRIAHQTEVHKTQWLKKTTCPFWNEEFVLHPKNPLSDILLVKIYDHDTVSNNDLLGQVEIPVSHLLNSNYAFEKWYPLVKLSGHHKAVAPGEVKLSVQYVNLSTTAFSTPTTTIVQQPMMQQPMVQPTVTLPPSYAPQQTFSPIPTNQYASPVMPVQQPMMQQPMVQQPMVQQPMMQQPMVQQPMMQQPMMQKPMVQQPMVQQQQFVQQPYVQQQPMVQQPMMQQPYVQQPMVQQPMMQQPYVQPMVQPQFVQQPVYVQPKPIVQPTVYVQPQPQVVVSPMMGMGMGMGMGYHGHHHHYGHHHKMKFKGYKKMYKGFKKFF